VRTLPAASRLRSAWPAAHLAWLVEPPAAPLLASQPWLDEVIVFPRERLARAAARGRGLEVARTLRDLVRALRARRFDLAVDFHGLARSALLARACGAPRRAGYARPAGRELSWLLATDRLRLPRRRLSRFARNDALVRFLGVPDDRRPQPLHVDPSHQARIAAALPGPAPVVLHPGTSARTPHKRWRPEGYAAVARALSADGVPCVVSFGPGERAAASAVVRASGGAARLAPETRDLPDLAALLGAARLLVGADTGPLHLASLAGTPVVQLQGPTDPVENEPWEGTPWRRVRVPVACSPCRRGCAAAPCMRILPEDAVVAAARELLAEGAAPARAAGGLV